MIQKIFTVLTITLLAIQTHAEDSQHSEESAHASSITQTPTGWGNEPRAAILSRAPILSPAKITESTQKTLKPCNIDVDPIETRVADTKTFDSESTYKGKSTPDDDLYSEDFAEAMRKCVDAHFQHCKLSTRTYHHIRGVSPDLIDIQYQTRVKVVVIGEWIEKRQKWGHEIKNERCRKIAACQEDVLNDEKASVYQLQKLDHLFKLYGCGGNSK